MRASDRRRRTRGYLMLEMIAVIAVLSVVMGLTVAVIVASRSRARRAIGSAEGRFQIGRASRLLAEDIRRARLATAGGGLVLNHGKAGLVTWTLRKGRLVRASGAKEQVFRAEVTGLRTSIAGGFVEVGIRLKKTGGSPARTVYVAARIRAGEAQR